MRTDPFGRPTSSTLADDGSIFVGHERDCGAELVLGDQVQMLGECRCGCSVMEACKAEGRLSITIAARGDGNARWKSVMVWQCSPSARLRERRDHPR